MSACRAGLRLVFMSSALATVATACSTGPDDEAGDCTDPVEFTVLPVSTSAISVVTKLGTMGPPVHTVPTDHVGIYLNGTGVPLVAPGPGTIVRALRVRYISSPFRQGVTDYALDVQLCQGHQLRLGHVQAVVASLAGQLTGGRCETYSTADERVESCRIDGLRVSLTAGQPLGTVGAASIGAFDFGVWKTGQRNFYVNASRYHSGTLTAVCPYDFFTPPLKSVMYSLISASGEPPRCGAMSVDVAGTAQGAWVLQSAPVNQAGDESNFAVLAPHPLFPVSGQTFSIGPPALSASTGPGNTRYPVTASGRVNRRFSDITPDNQVYCFVHTPATAQFSYFVRLSPASVLSLQRMTHVGGASPCNGDPSTWTMGASAVNFIR